jgi:hypothetical protein
METASPNESEGNYFAVSRLLRKMRRRSAARSESNAMELSIAGSVVFVITYLFAASLLWSKSLWWERAIALPLLVPAVWIAWLILLYLHSLVVKLCWGIGLCTDLSRNRIQSVLMGIVTTVFAAQLVASGSWLRWIGLLWIAAVAFNLTAALLLALFDEESR